MTPDKVAKPTRISYGFMVVAMVGLVWLHLATPFLTVLFSYFALDRLTLGRQKWFSVVVFLLLVAAIFYGFVFFLNNAFTALPAIISVAIPSFTKFAAEQGITLPFTDIESLKALAMDSVGSHLQDFGKFAKLATKEFAFLVMGIVIGISLYLTHKVNLGSETHVLKNNLYALISEQIIERFRTFYGSFATVMGAQLLISSINTVLTAIFVLWIRLPYAEVIVGLTFLCGMLPIIGNLISNTIIVGIAITISPSLAISALIFLIALHKGEYFLNSKIIGDRIKNPMWLTLLALIIGERIMGLPGMILAPVIFNYLKVETAQIELPMDDTTLPGPRLANETIRPVEQIKVVR